MISIDTLGRMGAPSHRRSAAGAFGLSLAEVVTFGIVLNIAAGAGAVAFAWIDGWLGSKRTIVVALIGLIAASMIAAAATTLMWLWVASIGIGLFVGPVQAASRSLMARLAPGQWSAGYFGLFALSGKATAFLGPAIALAHSPHRRAAAKGSGLLRSSFSSQVRVVSSLECE